jgi:hypothetical protein
MCGPQLANDLLGGNPFALGDLLAARCNRGFQASPILGVLETSSSVLVARFGASVARGRARR